MLKRPIPLAAVALALTLAACNNTRTQTTGTDQPPSLEQPGEQQPSTDNPGGGTTTPPGSTQPPSGGGNSQAQSETLDTSFGVNGVATIPATHLNSLVTDAALQADGKILVVGQVFETSYDIEVTRLNANGSLDSTFGEDGRVRIDLGRNELTAAVAVDTEGRIYVAGSSMLDYTQGSAEYYSDVLVTRLQPNGQVDGSYGAGGKVIIDIAKYDTGTDLVLGQDGSAFILGNSASERIGDRNSRAMLAHYDTSGRPISTFGTNGVTLLAAGTANEQEQLALFPDGRPLMMSIIYQQGPRGLVTRFNLDGSIDSTYGTVQPTGELYRFGPWDITVAADGTVILAGVSSGANDVNHWSVTVARLRPDGSQDGSFGSAGLAVSDYGDRDSTAGAVVLLSDGRIAAGGWAGIPNSKDGPQDVKAALSFFEPNGSLDADARDGGRIMQDLGDDIHTLRYRLLKSGDDRLLLVSPQGFSPQVFGGVAVAAFHQKGEK